MVSQQDIYSRNFPEISLLYKNHVLIEKNGILFSPNNFSLSKYEKKKKFENFISVEQLELCLLWLKIFRTYDGILYSHKVKTFNTKFIAIIMIYVHICLVLGSLEL